METSPFRIWDLKYLLNLTVGMSYHRIISLLTRLDCIPRPSWIPIERTLMALAPAHRQFLSTHFDPSFPACQTAEFLKWHRSNGLRVLYLDGKNDSEVAKAAEQTLFHWVLDREARKLEKRKLLPFSFVFSSRDPLRCSMKSMLSALWLSHFAGQNNSRNQQDYELMKDQYLLHHAWTEVDLFKLFTARYLRLMGQNTLLLIQDVHECDTRSRKAFWELLNTFAAKSETSIKIVVTGKESVDLLNELYQCKDISVDICEVAANDGTIGEDLDSLIASVCLGKQHNHEIQTKLEELKEMGAEKLQAILSLIMDLTGWPQDLLGKPFHDFSSHLQAMTISSTKDDILRRALRGISDQQGLRWIWNWISGTQRPLSYEELAMALCYRNYQETGTFHPPSQVELREALYQIRSWFRGITESCSGQVHVRNSVRHCLEWNSGYIWAEMASPHSILIFLLNYLTAPETQKRLEFICDEYESRVQRSGDGITPPLIADGHDILFYAVQALPYHSSENKFFMNEIEDELRATDWRLAPWSRAYWTMSNPFSRPEFGTIKSPYETLLKLGNMGTESIAIPKRAEALPNSVTVSIDTPAKPMELDSLVTAIREGKEDVALSLAKDLISLSKRDGSFDVSSGCSKIAWPPWFLWRATWLNMDRLVSLLLDDGMDLSPAIGAPTAFRSPLHKANRLCHASIMEIFFRHEARLGHEKSTDAKAKMLFVAAACGNIHAARSLVGKDRWLLEVRISTATPLVVASGNGNHGMVECLLELGADPNSGVGSTTLGLWAPLAIAAAFEHPKTMKILLHHKACVDIRGLESGTNPLFYAVRRMNVDLIRLLLDYGADPKHKYLDRPLLIEMVKSKASHKTKLGILDVLIKGSPLMMMNGQDSQGLTPLIHATRAGDLPMVKWLLDRGTNIDLGDNDGRSALFHALQTKHRKILMKLLEWEPSLHFLTSAGQTIFESAVENVSYVQLLLDAGADADISDEKGVTTISTAVIRGKASVVKLLVNRKVDIHRADKDGWSPIMHAASLGSDAKIVRILIKGGADLGKSECTKYSGLTPLLVTAKGGHAKIARILLEHRKMIDLEKRNRKGETPLLATKSKKMP